MRILRFLAIAIIYSFVGACIGAEDIDSAKGSTVEADVVESSVQDSRAEIELLLHRMSEGWNAKSGVMFARDFANDAVFTVWFGLQLIGSTEIAEGHQIIFDGIYSETDALFSAGKIRFLDDNTVIIHMNGYLFNSGAQADTTKPADFVPMMVAHRRDEGWQIEAFQNTRLDLSNMKGGKDIREDGAQ